MYTHENLPVNQPVDHPVLPVCRSLGCSSNYEQAGRIWFHSTRGWAVPRGSLSSQGAPAPGGWVGHDSCRAVPGNDVWNRRTWGICEICILTETAKISRKYLHPELANNIIRCRFTSLQTGLWESDSHSQVGQPTGRRSLSCSCRNNGNAPAGCASFCSPTNTVPRATKHQRLTACPIPEVFFPRPLDMVSRLHRGLCLRR